MGRRFVMDSRGDSVTSSLAGLLQLHEEQIRALQEEEAALNARAALLEYLADCLERDELPEELPEQEITAVCEDQQCVYKQDTMVCETPPSNAMTQEGSPPIASLEALRGERQLNATPSPVRRELEDFFSVKKLKRPRRVDPPSRSVMQKRDPENNSATAVDILAAIPRLACSELSADPSDDQLAVPLRKPINRMRTARQRARDYLEDATLYGEDNEHNESDDEGGTQCTPSSYWDISFPQSK
ncbi:hypothetical protein, conserved [Trypanosoma brucei gambiense DAL972]|uniref:Uncharacterized protein n=1 Tax=Trypanosoma brucei gambiense (strain MHOM/CI/86/DAL972) TaxID=679716 RepID=C9ZX34_TRYB9|nr:hypothetical protein, conserved [Trypanosoma brucei gambiense DAL972]CBH13975.1 hypothetical protein, conserved [Trypanosoma brucei gambiense DAL972]|eukprot:XP_011776249.1 hypothetical protein, conserved [Trypanosoma brucei gambiense DAL972]